MEHPDKLSFSSSFTYWERVRASTVLMFERKSGCFFALLWPLLAVGFAIMVLSKGRSLDAQAWFAMVLCLAFVPVMLMLGAAITHYSHKQSREPFTYVFDADGIRAVGVTYEFAHKWPAIFQVKRRAGFLMFFFSPGCAHCIPLRSIPDSMVQASLIAMAAANGADTRGV